MATVDGMTLARLLSLEASTVVDGAINGSGHLILTTHDGTDIDAGYALVAVPEASDTVQGVVELATNAETVTGTDVLRAVTPSGVASAIAAGVAGTVKYLSASSFAESSTASLYPAGVSLIYLDPTETTADWPTFSAKRFSVTTFNSSPGSNDVSQVAMRLNDTGFKVEIWVRSSKSNVWSSWAQLSNPGDSSTMGITGEIKMWSAASAPSGWTLCEGAAISRSTNAALFAVIGTTYGAGDGTTTFNVPDFRGRVPVGFDSTQTEFNARGNTGGEKTHVLTTAEMPSHTHTQAAHSHNLGGNGALTDGSTGTLYSVQNGTFYGFRAQQPPAATATNNNTGGGGAHNNLQPYLTIKYIIKL